MQVPGPWLAAPRVRLWTSGDFAPAWNPGGIAAGRVLEPRTDVDVWRNQSRLWLNRGGRPVDGAAAATADDVLILTAAVPQDPAPWTVAFRRRDSASYARGPEDPNDAPIGNNGTIRTCCAAHADAASSFHQLGNPSWAGCPTIATGTGEANYNAHPFHVGLRVVSSYQPTLPVLSGYGVEASRSVIGRGFSIESLYLDPSVVPADALRIEVDTQTPPVLHQATAELTVKGHDPGTSPVSDGPTVMRWGALAPGDYTDTGLPVPNWMTARAAGTRAQTLPYSTSAYVADQWDSPVDRRGPGGVDRAYIFGNMFSNVPDVPADPGTTERFRFAELGVSWFVDYTPRPYRFWFEELPVEPPIRVLRQIQRDDLRSGQVDSQQRSLRQVGYH